MSVEGPYQGWVVIGPSGAAKTVIAAALAAELGGALDHRLAHRRGHFMPPSLLDSQLEAFEPPQADEAAIVLPPGGDLEALVSLCLQAASGTPST